LDCELIVSGNIQTLSGVYTEKGVNTATALLNTDIDVSLTHQKTGAEFTCVLFDMLGTLNPDIFKSELDCEQPFHQRRAALERFCSTAWFKDNLAPFMQISEAHYSGKDAFLKAVIAQGKEGVILKNLRAPYIRGLNGFRPKTATLKFKRSVAGSLGSDIDCYIIGFVTSEYYDSRNWIAGIKLAVKLRDDNGNLREHWLATVTSMADEMRERLTNVHQDGRIDLRADYLGQVLVIDGQDISARNRRIAHAKVRWDIGFRPDKGPEDCILDESFIESQVF
jgi:ATP-dependent DNA ligase